MGCRSHIKRDSGLIVKSAVQFKKVFIHRDYVDMRKSINGYGGYGFNRYGFGGYGYPYYPPVYAYPPAVVVPSTPPVYIQQETQPIPAQTNYWYYCKNPDGYYPYIKDCPAGWLPVSPIPPGQ